MPDAKTQDLILDKLTELQKDVALLNTLLTGNGDSSKGLVVRVALIEQNELRRQWWTRTTIGAAFTAVATSATALGAVLWKKLSS